MLAKANYAWVYAAGPRKKHGCLIAYRKDTFECVRQKVITYDDQDVRQADDEKARRGSSFRTKNIGSLVALRKRGAGNDGVVVATTHLFWHPAYVIRLYARDTPPHGSQPAGTPMSVQGTLVVCSDGQLTDDARQAGILLREVTKFRSEGTEAESLWSSIIAGGAPFNIRRCV